MLSVFSPAAAEPDEPASSVASTPQAVLRDAATARVMTDLPDGPLTSPLTINGTVSGHFFNEGFFPVRLFGPQGDVIAEAFANPGEDGWMIDDPVPFHVTLTFAVRVETDALLVFEQDTSDVDGPPPLDVRRKVVLIPSTRR